MTTSCTHSNAPIHPTFPCPLVESTPLNKATYIAKRTHFCKVSTKEKSINHNLWLLYRLYFAPNKHINKNIYIFLWLRDVCERERGGVVWGLNLGEGQMGHNIRITYDYDCIGSTALRTYKHTNTHKHT